jgi:hypothetical protein
MPYLRWFTTVGHSFKSTPTNGPRFTALGYPWRSPIQVSTEVDVPELQWTCMRETGRKLYSQIPAGDLFAARCWNGHMFDLTRPHPPTVIFIDGKWWRNSCCLHYFNSSYSLDAAATMLNVNEKKRNHRTLNRQHIRDRDKFWAFNTLWPLTSESANIFSFYEYDIRFPFRYITTETTVN